MADNEETPVVPKNFGEFRKSTKLYSAADTDALLEKNVSAAMAREAGIDEKIVNLRSDTGAAIAGAKQEMQSAIVSAKAELEAEIASAVEGGGIHYMGVLDTLDELNALPVSVLKHGLYWIVREDQCAHVWTVPADPDGIAHWEVIGGGAAADLSNYYTKDQTYNREEIDIIKDRAAACETKLAAIVAATQSIKNIEPLANEEYTTDQIQSVTNSMLAVLKVIANITS